MFVCSRMLLYIKYCSWGFEILRPFVSEFGFHWLQLFFFSSSGYLFELIFVSYTVSWVLTFISFNIWRWKCKSIQVFTSGTSYLTLWEPNSISKRPLSDWFGPKLKCKVSSYIDNAIVLLCSRLNLGFNRNYFSFLL